MLLIGQNFLSHLVYNTLIAILACCVAAAWFLLFVFTVARTVKPKYKPLLVKVTAIGGTYCPKCKQDGGKPKELAQQILDIIKEIPTTNASQPNNN